MRVWGLLDEVAEGLPVLALIIADVDKHVVEALELRPPCLR